MAAALVPPSAPQLHRHLCWLLADASAPSSSSAPLLRLTSGSSSSSSTCSSHSRSSPTSSLPAPHPFRSPPLHRLVKEGASQGEAHVLHVVYRINIEVKERKRTPTPGAAQPPNPIPSPDPSSPPPLASPPIHSRRRLRPLLPRLRERHRRNGERGAAVARTLLRLLPPQLAHTKSVSATAQPESDSPSPSPLPPPSSPSHHLTASPSRPPPPHGPRVSRKNRTRPPRVSAAAGEEGRGGAEPGRDGRTAPRATPRHGRRRRRQGRGPGLPPGHRQFFGGGDPCDGDSLHPLRFQRRRWWCSYDGYTLVGLAASPGRRHGDEAEPRLQPPRGKGSWSDGYL
ncbi:proline-rich receptor-like protein kinase PERK9 [Triticum urartu]|uniref:proline-rich receptor-like protein kinase PERK9 n=1 Tax=Triticum urartu TaxID=4572 RepID=UPI002042CFAA|nr:proline-rich receptor-like protein kinase PERK9 [Triticum urartu]